MRTILTLAATLFLAAAPLHAQDEVVTKQYDDGSVYEGTFLNGLQHGTGTYTLPNGFSYTGDWSQGQIVGQGIARYPDGSVYE
ncbi:MAG: 2-isopropylmalate synthase, partial [Paracoccaceae bacterium]